MLFRFLRAAPSRLVPLYMLILLIGTVGCDSAETMDPEDDTGRVVEGVDLDLLFASPAAAELDGIQADWATRDVSARDVRIDSSFAISLGGTPGTAQVLSHVVDGARHYGLLLLPDARPPEGVPSIVLTHGGDEGVGLNEPLSADAAGRDALTLITLGLDQFWPDFAYIVPSFRAEPLVVGGRVWLSEGDASPWDRDVDDALALVNAALETAPGLDPTRIGALGYSRGGTVALLMAIRDPRIVRLSAFFGPTDFLFGSSREFVADALRGNVADLPGLDVLNEDIIVPLRAGTLPLAEARLALIRRSPVYFADRLPEVQVHHGQADTVVPVEQTERLSAIMAGLARTPPAYEAFLYNGGGHSPLTMPQSTQRSGLFLSALLTVPSAPAFD
ncbi:MAG: peptidase [Bacteroidota bacterium]